MTRPASFLPQRLSTHQAILLLASALSLLVSAWLIAIDPVINNDGVLYLVAAEVFVESGLRASVDIYHWPFLQLLIGGLHALTGLGFAHAAHLIVTLCYLLLAVAFVRTVKEMGGNSTVQLLALIVIIFSAQISDFRSLIFREPGMLAFMLLALVELIRYSKTSSWRHAGQWLLYLVLAFLFRVEALSLALLSPFGLLLVSGTPLHNRWRQLGKLIILPCGALVTVLAISSLVATNLLSQLKAVEDLSILSRGLLYFPEHLAKLSHSLVDSGLLRRNSVDDAAWGVIGLMFTILAVNLIAAISLPYLALLSYQVWRGTPLRVCPVSDRLIKVHFFIIGLYQLMFIFFAQFSLARYALQMALLVLLYVPFILAGWWQSRQLTPRVLVVVLLCGYGLDTLINSRYKKIYLNEAAQWLEQSPAVEGLKVVSNDHYIAYRSGRVSREDILIARRKEVFTDTYLPWQPGLLYAYNFSDAAELDALRAEVKEQGGEILGEFGATTQRPVVIFIFPEPQPH